MYLLPAASLTDPVTSFKCNPQPASCCLISVTTYHGSVISVPFGFVMLEHGESQNRNASQWEGRSMYETLMNTLREFFGRGALKTCLIIAVSCIVVVLSANVSSFFREAMARARERRCWRSTVVVMGVGLFKFLVIFVLTRFFMTAMHYQSALFAGRHGRVTEQNRSAVLMKWGSPHEQKELGISHTRKRILITRQLQTRTEKPRVLSESYWKDEELPVKAVDGRMPQVLSVKEEDRNVAVSQKSIVSADVEISVQNNPRTLGNANYAGYDDVWRLEYVVANRSKWHTTARMSFPLPARTGLFDGMYVKVDGTNISEKTQSSGSSVHWSTEMAPHSQQIVEIGYRSRGLEHLRYIPRRMTQTGHYRVTMNIMGIPASELDYPIGSMPPAEKLLDIKGSRYKLTWKLDNALTSYDIGIKLPMAQQPEYHFARLIREAPVGLILLFILLTVPCIVTGRRVRIEIIACMGAAYYLHYTFMGRLAELVSDFTVPFLVSSVAIIILMAWFRAFNRHAKGRSVRDIIVFSMMVLCYPLAIVDSERTGFWMQVFYIGSLLYFCGLIVAVRMLPRRRTLHHTMK